MTFSKLALACSVALWVAPMYAEDAAPTETETASVASPATSGHEVQMGPVGQDEAGRSGRLHTVARGDTLWDISDTYLGTPWVWPSIWTDNGSIENPHRIYPGDMLWITPHEMRKVTDAEAAALLAGAELPAALEDGMAGLGTPEVYTYTEIQSTGFVSRDMHRGSATIVQGTPVDRTWFSDHDKVVIGFGEGETQVGAQYDIFRTAEKVTDPDTGILFGYHTEYLGWLEVTDVQEESSWAIIRLSRSEIQNGDELLPRRPRSAKIEISAKPETEGHIAFTPNRRLEMASTDVVYLNRGTQHGLAMGSPLEVFRPLEDRTDKVKGERLKMPDRIVAKLVVVDLSDESAVAVITHTTTELLRGDRFRGSENVKP